METPHQCFTLSLLDLHCKSTSYSLRPLNTENYDFFWIDKENIDGVLAFKGLNFFYKENLSKKLDEYHPTPKLIQYILNIYNSENKNTCMLVRSLLITGHVIVLYASIPDPLNETLVYSFHFFSTTLPVTVTWSR